MHIMFQAHVPLIFGAFLAMILPDTDSRVLPLQREIYWVQVKGLKIADFSFSAYSDLDNSSLPGSARRRLQN